MTKLTRKSLLITALVLLFAVFAAVGLSGLNRLPALAEGIEINATSFPDEAFRSYVSATFDADEDGFLSASEIESATSVDLTALEEGAVKDITGIEHFTAAEDISLGRSAVPWADLSGLEASGRLMSCRTDGNTISITTDEDAKFDLATIVPDVSKIKRDSCEGFTFDSEEGSVVTFDADAFFYGYVYTVDYSTLGLVVNVEVTIPGLYKDITVTTDAADDADAKVLVTDFYGEPITTAKAGDLVELRPQDGANHYFIGWQVISGEIEIDVYYYSGEGLYCFNMPDSPVEIKALYQETTHNSHGVCGEEECSLLDGDSSCAVDHAPINGKWLAWGNHPWHQTLPFVSGSYYLVNDVVTENSLYVADDLTLDICLNGYNIEFIGEYGSNADLTIDGTLSLCDCNSSNQTHKFTPNEDGTWILDEENGTKTVDGGAICGANSIYGNVCVTQTGSFVMYGGNIVGCAFDVDYYPIAGVYNEGTVETYGGAILGNQGSGVYNIGVFAMYGGSILENQGSGVDTESVFTMYGGNIEYNRRGVCDITLNAFIKISGTAVIKNNVDTDDYGVEFNSNLLSYHYDSESLFERIEIGELEDGAEIGIGHGFYDGFGEHFYSMGVFTEPLVAPLESGLTDKEYAQKQASYLFSDCEDYVIRANALNQIEIMDALYPTESVEINEVNFPDVVFRNEVSSYDEDEDGYLSPEEIYNVDYISMFNDGVKNMKGVEYFVNLKQLSLTYNDIETLDLSAFVKLEYLGVSGNLLTKLDLSANKNLYYLDCSGNEIDEIIFNEETKLETFVCDYNKLTQLNLPFEDSLKELDCSGNYLEALDLSAFTILETLVSSDNNFTDDSLKLPASLEYLYLDGCGLSQIDLSNLTALRYLDLSDNLFTEIPTLPSTVDMLAMNGNKLTEINYERLANVEDLFIDGNALTSFDTSLLPNLNYVTIYDNYFRVTYSGNTLDLTTLPTGFDLAKASNWKNATVEGNILTVADPNSIVSYIYDMGGEFSAVFNLVNKAPEITDFDLIIDMDFLKPVAGEDTYRDAAVVVGAADGLSFEIVDADWYDITHGEEWEGDIYAEHYCDISDEGYRFLANTAYYFNIDLETQGYFTFHEEFISAYKLNGQSPVYYEMNGKYYVSLYYAMPATGDIDYIELIGKIEISDQVISAPKAGETILRDEYALAELLAGQRLVYQGFIWGDEEFNEYGDFYENGGLLSHLYFDQKSAYSLIITVAPEFGFNFDEDILISFDGKEADFVEFNLVENSISFGWIFETGDMPTVDESEKYISQINLVFGEDELPLPVALEKTGRSSDALMALTAEEKYTFSEIVWMWEDVDSGGGSFLPLSFDENSTDRFDENTVYYIEFTVVPKPGYSFKIDSDENGTYDIMEEVYVTDEGFFMANVFYNGEKIHRSTQSYFWESVYFFNNGALVVRFPYAQTGEHGECVYDRVERDSQGHWTACACGEIEADSYAKHSGGVASCQAKAVCSTCNQKYGDYAYHAGGTATCTEKAKCSTCNNEYGELKSHDFSVKDHDQEHHFNKCASCGEVETAAKAEHSFDGGVCVCGFEKPGLSGWGVAGIAGGGAAVLGGGFAIFWFVIKKKRG